MYRVRLITFNESTTKAECIPLLGMLVPLNRSAIDSICDRQMKAPSVPHHGMDHRSSKRTSLSKTKRPRCYLANSPAEWP